MAVTTIGPIVSSSNSTVGFNNLPGGGSQQQSQINFDANDVIVTVTICIIIVCLGLGFLVRTYCLKTRLRRSRRDRAQRNQHRNQANGDGSANTEGGSNELGNPANGPHRMPAYMGSSNVGFDPYEPPPPSVWFTMPPSYEDAMKSGVVTSAKKQNSIVTGTTAGSGKGEEEAEAKTSTSSAVASNLPSSGSQQATPVDSVQPAVPSTDVLPSYDDSIMSCPSPSSSSSPAAIDGTVDNNRQSSATASGSASGNQIVVQAVASTQDVGITINHPYSSVDVD